MVSKIEERSRELREVLAGVRQAERPKGPVEHVKDHKQSLHLINVTSIITYIIITQ